VKKLGALAATLFFLAVCAAGAAGLYAIVVWNDRQEEETPGDFPEWTLSVGGAQLESENWQQLELDGIHVQVVERMYRLSDGRGVRALSASSPVYLTRLAGTWRAQMVEGYQIADLQADCLACGESRCIVAVLGGYCYLLEVGGEDPEGQTLYWLGVHSRIGSRQSGDADG
jgi:hypothetical protein